MMKNRNRMGFFASFTCAGFSALGFEEAESVWRFFFQRERKMRRLGVAA